MGATSEEGAEAIDGSSRLTAIAVNLYEVPLTRPVIVHVPPVEFVTPDAGTVASTTQDFEESPSTETTKRDAIFVPVRATVTLT